MAGIPALRIAPNGLAHWDEVPIGGYVTARLPFGPHGNKDVLLRKRTDGTATVMLMPNGGHLVKSLAARLGARPAPLAKSFTTADKPPVGSDVVPSAPATRAGVPELVMPDLDLHTNPALVQGRDGVHLLPPDEAERARHGGGKWTQFPSVGMKPLGDEAARYGQDIDPYPLHDWAGRSEAETADALKGHLLATGGEPSDKEGYDVRFRLPTGHHAHINTAALAERLNRPDEPIHPYAALPALGHVLSHPGQLWHDVQGDRYHALGFPRHNSHSDALGRHFPAGLAVAMHPMAGTDARDLAVDDLDTGTKGASDAPNYDDFRARALGTIDRYRHGAVRYVNHAIGGEDK